MRPICTVSADLGNGFGRTPEIAAETIRLAAEVGLAGCTIEDATGNQDAPLYDFSLAVERIAAAAEAIRALEFPFILTARAHNFLYAAPRVEDTIDRLQAFEKAGADVLFAPIAARESQPDLTRGSTRGSERAARQRAQRELLARIKISSRGRQRMIIFGRC